MEDVSKCMNGPVGVRLFAGLHLKERHAHETKQSGPCLALTSSDALRSASVKAVWAVLTRCMTWRRRPPTYLLRNRRTLGVFYGTRLFAVGSPPTTAATPRDEPYPRWPLPSIHS